MDENAHPKELEKPLKDTIKLILQKKGMPLAVVGLVPKKFKKKRKKKEKVEYVSQIGFGSGVIFLFTKKTGEVKDS